MTGWIKRHVWLILIGGLLLVASTIGWPVVYLSRTREYEPVRIPVGNYEISGILSRGSNASGAFVILVHGNRGEGIGHELYRRILNNLDRRTTILAINLSGFGESSREATAVSEKIFDRSEEVLAAVDFLEDISGSSDDQIVLIGHSLGAAQIFNVACDRRFRLAIAIGMGDYERVLIDREDLEQYAYRFEKNSNSIVDRDRLLTEMRDFTPEVLFSSCPMTPMAIIYGSREYDRRVIREWYETLPAGCRANSRWIVIPVSNHMYWTENDNLPQPLGDLQADLSVSLLVYRLNGMLR